MILGVTIPVVFAEYWPAVIRAGQTCNDLSGRLSFHRAIKRRSPAGKRVTGTSNKAGTQMQVYFLTAYKIPALCNAVTLDDVGGETIS